MTDFTVWNVIADLVGKPEEELLPFLASLRFVEKVGYVVVMVGEDYNENYTELFNKAFISETDLSVAKRFFKMEIVLCALIFSKMDEEEQTFERVVAMTELVLYNKDKHLTDACIISIVVKIVVEDENYCSSRCEMMFELLE